MLCREANALLTEAEEGALHGVKKVLFDLHLAVCAPCRRYRAQLEATVGVLRRLPKEAAPTSLVDALAATLGKDEEGRK